MKFCPNCGSYWEDIEESCKRCGAQLASTGHVDSTPGLNRTFVRILAVLCIACGLVAAYLVLLFGLFFEIGLSGMARGASPPTGVQIFVLLVPVATGLPFFIVSFFLFRFRPWARRAFVVLLTLELVPIAQILGDELGLQDFELSAFGGAFTFLAAVLVLTIMPWTRKAFAQPARRWWLEAGLAVLTVLMVFSTSLRSTIVTRQELDAASQRQERDEAEFINLLQSPESPETDARISQLMSAGVFNHLRGRNDMPPLALVAKNHPRVVKALLAAGAGPLDPIVWEYLAEGGHFDLLPDVVRAGIRPDPKVAEQFGVELIRIIREGRNDPGYRERVTGLILGGADLNVIDHDATALGEAMRSGQTDIEDQLREQMELPTRSQLSEPRNEVELSPRVYDFHQPGPCPKTVVFNEEFTLKRRETVFYRFTNETTPALLPDTQELKADVGRNTVSLKRVIGVPGQKYSGWVRFELIAGELHLKTGQSPFAVDCH